jgi:hypothetical protein
MMVYIYKGDFYATWTRHATILEYPDLSNKKFPNASQLNKIRIGSGRGWWRGMVIAAQW